MSVEKAKGNPKESTPKVATYVWHRGSVRVSGVSQVYRTGLCAYHEYKRGTRPIEFVFLGGNAGQQVFKACVTAKREIEATSNVHVSFEPLWTTVLSDPRNGQDGCIKDASVWRMVITERKPKA